MAPAGAQLAKVTDWFESNGGWLNPSVELSFSQFKGTLLRVKDDAKSALEKGTRVISCPHSLTLSALNAVELQPAFRKAQLIFGEAESRDLNLPADFVANARRQCIAAVVLATQKFLSDQNGGRGFWDAYIECLPSLPHERGQGNSSDECVFIDTPMWWEESKSALLSTTNVGKGLKDLESTWKDEWALWSPVLEPWAATHGIVLSWWNCIRCKAFKANNLRVFAPRIKPSCVHQARAYRASLLDNRIYRILCLYNLEPDSFLNLYKLLNKTRAKVKSVRELYKWSLSILDSRAFGSSQISMVESSHGVKARDKFDPDMLLYPVFDMLNHDPSTMNHWHSDSEAFHLVCDDEPGPGEEIFSYYGPKSNDELLLSYGFCVENNPFESISLRLVQRERGLYPRSFQNEPSHGESSSNEDANAPRHFHDFEDESKYGNTRTPLPQDSKTATFYVRSTTLRNSNDNRLGYPDVSTNEAAFHRWKSLFPEDFLSFVALKIANGRERTFFETQMTNMKPRQIYKYMGLRNDAAVASNLLLILLAEVQKLRAWEEKNLAKDSQQAMHHLQVYRSEKERLLSECTSSLRTYLGCVTSTLSSNENQVSHFLTIPYAYGLLVSLPSPINTVTRLFLRRAGVTAEDHFPDPGHAILLCIFFIGLISQLPIHLKNQQSDMDTYRETLSRHKVFVSKFPTFARDIKSEQTQKPAVPKYAREDNEGLVNAMQDLVTNTRNAAPGRFKVDELANPLRPSFWTESLIEDARDIVEEEIVDVCLTPSQRRHMDEQWKNVFPSLETGDVNIVSGEGEDENEGELVPVLYFPAEWQEEEDKKRTKLVPPTASPPNEVS